MKRFAAYLVWLLLFGNTRLQNGPGADFDVQEFKRSVVQGYNASKSFSENFYELLGLICPESVYCQSNGTFDTENADFRDIVEDETLDPEGFLQNYDQTAIAEARIFLQRNAHHLPGCCVACSCNDDCSARHNCCPSMHPQIINSNGLDSTKLANQECIYANSKSYLDNFQYTFSETVGLSYFMVSDCASINVSRNIVTKCMHPDPEQPDETIPVYSTDVKRIYRNIFCASCNDVTRVTRMTVSVIINHQLSFTGAIRLPSSPCELYAIAMSHHRLFEVSYTFPSNSLDVNNFLCIRKPSHDHSATARCDTNPNLDANQVYFFERACEMKQNIYYTDRYSFTNVFCYLCRRLFTSYKPMCETFQTPDRNGQVAFSVLIANSLPDPFSQPEDTSKTNAPCSCAELVDTSKNVCREILCPPGEMRNMCACVSFITNITGMRIKLHLELRPQLPDSATKERFEGELQTDVPAAITKTVKRLIASHFGPLTSINQFLFLQSNATRKSVVTLHYCEVLTLNDVPNVREVFENMVTTLHAGFTRKIVGTTMEISLGRVFNLDSAKKNATITDPIVGTSVTLERLYPGRTEFRNSFSVLLFSQPLKKLVYCKRIKLDEDEEERLYNVTADLGWSQAYLEYVYWQEDGSMCLEDFEAAFMPNNSSGTNSYKYLTYQNLIIIALTFHSIVFYL